MLELRKKATFLVVTKKHVIYKFLKDFNSNRTKRLIDGHNVFSQRPFHSSNFPTTEKQEFISTMH